MKKYFLIAVVFYFVGCAGVPVYTSYRIPKPISFETPDILSVIVTTLQDNGFQINFVNDKVGIITTEYLFLNGAFDKGFIKAVWGAEAVRRIKITVSIDQNIKLIKMNPVIEELTETNYGAGTPDPVSMTEKEKNKVMKIMKEISVKLSIDESRIEIIEESYE